MSEDSGVSGFVLYVTDLYDGYDEMPTFDNVNHYFVRPSTGERLVHWVDPKQAFEYASTLSDHDPYGRTYAMWRFTPDRAQDNMVLSPDGLLIVIFINGAPFVKAYPADKIDENDFTIILPLIFNQGVPG